VGFDGIGFTKYSIPRLATIQQDVDTIARKGVNDLLMRISYECPAAHEKIPYRFVHGESVAQPRQ
jgi:LacI family transcriptional regulator